jgi:hypothetical protein
MRLSTGPRGRRTRALVAGLGILAALAPTPAVTASAPVAPAQPTQPAAESSAVVHAWERTLLRTVYAENATPIPVGVPYMGFTSVAMHDAAKAAARRGGSAHAAVAVAAHDVLHEFFPASRPNLHADLTSSLAAVPEGDAKEAGVAAGARAADRMLAERGAYATPDTSIVYEKPVAPGTWQPAPGGAMLAPWLAFVEPMVLSRPLDLGGPDALTSAGYTRDYLEVRSVGAATGADRTAYQTETARFFNANSAVMVSDALLRYLDGDPLGLRETTRLFAVAHAAMTDALISTWRLKYDVGFWRPFQAIHGADGDRNPGTQPDPTWAPLIPNPPYSEYVSGHASLTAPAVETVRRLLGEETPLALRSSITGTERTYPTLSALEHDAFMARIWGGLHFRDAMEDGYAIGHRAARRALHEIH